MRISNSGKEFPLLEAGWKNDVQYADQRDFMGGQKTFIMSSSMKFEATIPISEARNLGHDSILTITVDGLEYSARIESLNYNSNETASFTAIQVGESRAVCVEPISSPEKKEEYLPEVDIDLSEEMD